jgi:hypothetical protein
VALTSIHASGASEAAKSSLNMHNGRADVTEKWSTNTRNLLSDIFERKNEKKKFGN